VVKLVGLLAQVRLGGAIAPEGHGSDLERARGTAVELVNAELELDGERATEAQIATALVVATAVATRFLESAWETVLHVASELIAAEPDYVTSTTSLMSSI
jgi:hypothetical protein